MASGVSVESAAIQGGIGCCKTSIHELESASRSLQRAYQQAGSGGWKDQKYAALGGIVEAVSYTHLTLPTKLEV